MLPSTMNAWVVREERHGSPRAAMKLETVEVPRPGPGEVLLRVRAAGVNHNHLWACRGVPVPISRLHPAEPRHIGGSDASGEVAAVGEGVRAWKEGDHVVTHPNWCCGHCPECLGRDSLACREQKAWGFETSWGSFAEYALVQAQQLLPKPTQLSWEAASCYGLKLFTAWRMLFVRSRLQPGQLVLIWGAAGGTGSYAVRLCSLVGAQSVAIVSSEAKAAYCRALGATWVLNRGDFPLTDAVAPDDAMRAFRKGVLSLTKGRAPEIVFETVGRSTLPASLFVCARMGQVVVCGATSGPEVSFDARYLWMHQKSIVGSHGCNAYDAQQANELVRSGALIPTLTKSFPFEQAAEAHEFIASNTHLGSVAIGGTP